MSYRGENGWGKSLIGTLQGGITEQTAAFCTEATLIVLKYYSGDLKKCEIIIIKKLYGFTKVN